MAVEFLCNFLKLANVQFVLCCFLSDSACVLNFVRLDSGHGNCVRIGYVLHCLLI